VFSIFVIIWRSIHCENSNNRHNIK